MSRRLVNLRWWCLAALGCVLPGQGRAAPLRTIVYFQGQAATPRPLGFWLRPNGILPIAPPTPDPRREAVLEILPLPPTPPLPAQVIGVVPLPKQQTLRLFGQRLLPRLLLLAPGGELQLRNDDEQPVTIELVPSPPGQPSLRLAPGASQSLRLPQSGELSLHVRERSQAQATVLRPLHLATHLLLSEVGKVAVATVDVPPGRYQVRLRMPTGSLWQEEVVVERDGRELSLHVSLGEER